jgi:hypothetical protein
MQKEGSVQQSTYNLLVCILAPIESGLSNRRRLGIVLGSLIRYVVTLTSIHMTHSVLTCAIDRVHHLLVVRASPSRRAWSKWWCLLAIEEHCVGLGFGGGRENRLHDDGIDVYRA